MTAPAFPELTTFGEDQDDALKRARDAVEEAIAARIAHREDIPSPLKNSADKGWFVEVPWLVLFKSALYTLCRAKNVSPAELARRMGVHREQVDRLFRLDHNSQIGQFEAAFKAIGHPLDDVLSLAA